MIFIINNTYPLEMKPNKSYKALMVEIEVAEKIKKAKPDKMTMTEFLLKLLDKK